ncbi:unnamed protein product [Camellia sinensis]
MASCRSSPDLLVLESYSSNVVTFWKRSQQFDGSGVVVVDDETYCCYC